jgi:lysozyme family protein
MANLTSLSKQNSERFRVAKMTRGPEFDPVARRLLASKSRFQGLAAQTRVPWFVIAVIKERESGVDAGFLGNIANGQPWSQKTTIVPVGRGPFKNWEAAGVDALVNCAPYASRWTDWSVGGALTLLEQYNGLGYANKGLPSPYIWSGTDQYAKGKYIADGKFDPNAVDKQLGCAGILMAMQQIDSSISFGASAAPAVVHTTQQPVVAANTAAVPSITNPAPGSIGAWIASFFKKAA